MSSMNVVDARADAGGRVRCTRLVDAQAPGLVPDFGPLGFGQQRKRRGHGPVQDPRALTAADDQETAPLRAARAEPLVRRRRSR